jgi:hypothetical protein
VDPLVVFIVAFGLFFLGFILLLGAYHPKRGSEIVGKSERNPAADAEIEAGDIEMMIEARNDIRRRRGLPEIGDDLEAELQEELRRRER